MAKMPAQNRSKAGWHGYMTNMLAIAVYTIFKMLLNLNAKDCGQMQIHLRLGNGENKDEWLTINTRSYLKIWV